MENATQGVVGIKYQLGLTVKTNGTYQQAFSSII